MKTDFKFNFKNIFIISVVLLISIELVASAGKVRKDELKRVLQENYNIPQQENIPNNSDTQDKTEVKDELFVPRYKSELKQEQREEYMNWVEFKNSFNPIEGQLAKLTKYFAPENPKYYSAIYKSGWPFYSIAGVFGLVLLAYLIMRFGFRYCLGPKSHITSFFGFFTWSLIGKIDN
jgi:hypothetical protein